MSTRKTPPPHALVVVRTRPDESSTRHEVTRAAAPDRDALATAVAADPALHEVRRGELLKIAVDAAVMNPVELLALLRPVGDTADEDEDAWPEAVAESYADVEASVGDYVRDVRPVRRWVTVNGARATGVLDPDDDQRVHLVLLEEGGEGLAPGGPIAASHWANDGAGVVWACSYAVELVAPGLLLDRRVGDDDTAQRLLVWPERVDQQAALVAGWVRSTEQEVAAALGLEPLDPSGVLDEHATAVWRERIDDVELSFEPGGSPALVAAVRAALDRPGSPYAITREALAEPTSERGTALAAVVDAWFAGEESTGGVRFWTGR